MFLGSQKVKTKGSYGATKLLVLAKILLKTFFYYYINFISSRLNNLNIYKFSSNFIYSLFFC